MYRRVGHLALVVLLAFSGSVFLGEPVRAVSGGASGFVLDLDDDFLVAAPAEDGRAFGKCPEYPYSWTNGTGRTFESSYFRFTYSDGRQEFVAVDFNSYDANGFVTELGRDVAPGETGSGTVTLCPSAGPATLEVNFWLKDASGDEYVKSSTEVNFAAFVDERPPLSLMRASCINLPLVADSTSCSGPWTLVLDYWSWNNSSAAKFYVDKAKAPPRNQVSATRDSNFWHWGDIYITLEEKLKPGSYKVTGISPGNTETYWTLLGPVEKTRKSVVIKKRFQWPPGS